MNGAPAIWFPTIRTGTGTDVFTERLVASLQARELRAEITWLPLRAEYAPWTVSAPAAPEWATSCHVNTWLHPRFIPKHLPVTATLHHSVHDPALRSYKGWLRTAYHSWWVAPIERKVLRYADHVIAVSQFAADMARRTLCDVPMQVIYNGIDTELFRPGNRKRQPNGAFQLLYVGSWMARKGVDLLAPIMRGLGEGFELHYTGGPAAGKDKLDMPANMHDLGRLSGGEVIAAMQNADALLFPSRSEGFGLVAAEAMACGLPVIAADVASVPEVIISGETGILCRTDAVNTFVAAARYVAQEVAAGARMSKKARSHAVERFGIESMTNAYIVVYRSLIDSPSSSVCSIGSGDE